MKLSKLKLCNYRCFGNDEQTIKIENITSFIGNNSSGKTAALSALNCLFSEISSERVLKRSDFHLPKDTRPELQESQNMYIEAIFTFNELEGETEEESYAIPYFSNYLVVDDCEETPYLRIRLEATWQNSNNIEGAIESKIYYITCPEVRDITDEDKFVAPRKDLDCIRVIYVPAVRDPSKQLRNVSGTMMYQLMNSINWSQTIKEKVKGKIQELNNHFLEEKGIEIIASSIRTQWESYDNDIRYSDAQLRFNSIDIESAIKKSEVVFSPTITGKEYGVDDLSDGLRSLFYISLVDSILDAEAKIQQQIETGDNVANNYRPPVLTIIALEEPENHIAPHLMGQLVSNLINISSKHNAQTILTSHSTSIIKRLEPEKLRYFRFNISDCITKVNSITLPDKEKMADQYKFIKEAVKAYPELYFAKVVILGEGDSEEIILPKMWSAKNGDIDLSGISVVPLGGRHVNHFWRLLKNLDIPHITLLDLDRERFGGGWGRIKYVLEQLLKFNYKKEDLLRVKSGILSDEKLKSMHTWDSSNIECLQSWINFLEKYNVFFSTPLDIDFMMLEKYEDIYKKMLEDKEGPYLMINTNGKTNRRYIKEIEGLETFCQEYETRINIDIHNTLKACGGNGDTYSREQRQLMIWYNYFFLNRGKPSTHIEALSKITDETLISTMPSVFERMIVAVERMLEGTLD